jgi:hypothetical protein
LFFSSEAADFTTILGSILAYAFKDIAEIEYFIKQAYVETIDSIFLKHKSIWKKIVVTNNEVITLLATDSIYIRTFKISCNHSL